MSKENPPEIAPNVCVNHDRERYYIDIELPGVKKEDIELEVGEQSFCIKAPTKDFVYHACYTLAHTIDPKGVEAKFNNGLLTVKAPLKSKIGGIKVAIK